MNRRHYLAGVFLLAISLLTACSEETPTAQNGDEPFVFVSAVDINVLDPQKMTWNQDIRTAGCLWEPLVRFKLPEMEIEPAVAESWQISEDGKTYTFQLRRQAKWSNGDPVVAGDFIFAWMRALMPDFAADYSQLFYCISGAREFFDRRAEQIQSASGMVLQEVEQQFREMVGIESPDDHTLIVHLKEPTPYFIELCAFATYMPNHRGSVSKAMTLNSTTHMYELPADLWVTPGQMITNGPYVLNRYRFKRDILVTQNPHWWNKASMRNTGILQKIIERPETALLTYESGEADWLPDLPSALSLAADLLQSGREDVHGVPWAGTYFYSYNCLPTLPDGSKNPVADKRVRLALSKAIDRKTLVSQVTRMNQPIGRTFTPPGMMPGYESPVEDGAAFDPAAARKLLAEAGYSDPSKLTGLTILFNTGGGHEPVAQAIQRMWQSHLGITVKIESMEVRSFREKLKNQQYTIARAAWIGDYRDPTTFLNKYHSKGGNNDAKFNNAEYDALLGKASQEADSAKRTALLRQAEQILVREQPITPIYHYITLHVYDPERVIGLHPNEWNFRRLELVKVNR